jgi:predicted glycogen debranching enzyme
VRPFLSGRDYHALQRENEAFRFEAERRGDALRFRPYPGIPGIEMRANAAFAAEPLWYRQFLYAAERARGFPHAEDLASPGVLHFDLAAGDAVWILSADGLAPDLGAEPAPLLAERLRRGELARRAGFASALERAADAYVVRRGAGATLVAGYPWFTDWGRDTFIALRGLALATGRLELARDVLLEWSGAVSEGMLPNRFPDRGEAPEYNSVDASLWFCVVAAELIAAAARAGKPLAAAERRALEAAADAILRGYEHGTRYGIGADSDGLLRAGAPGTQLTWMDARIGARPVTPRTGKPVEVQALWVNALHAAGAREPAFAALAHRAERSFAERFVDPARGWLADVVDVDGRPGAVDAALRPNQVLALGGLPRALVRGASARRALDAVEGSLYTPLGLRSLAPGEPGYAGRYAGGPEQRDGAYHQGTAWPWLLGPFVEAWVRARGGRAAARGAARARFLAPLLAHLGAAGLGHVSELADGDAPHAPGGCPFQAWSLGELLRLDRVILAAPGAQP